MTVAPRHYALGAAALAAVAAGVELVLLFAAPRRIPGFAVGTTDVVALVVIVSLAATAIGIAAHKSFGPVVGVIAALATLGYGASADAARAHWGTIYMVVGIAILYALGKALPYLRTPTEA